MTKPTEPSLEPTPEEQLALAAEQIAAAVERLHKGRLNERAILLLIRDACHPTVSMQTIKIVLNTVRRLPEIYLLKPETKGKK